MKIFGLLIFLLTVTVVTSGCVGVSQTFVPPTGAPSLPTEASQPTSAPATGPLLPTRILVPTSEPTRTPITPPKRPNIQCTPPSCAAGETYACGKASGDCPGGCGTICVKKTSVPSTPEAIPTAGGGNVQDPQLQKLINDARADLTQRAKVPDSAITIKRAKAVEWSDSSLGCPQPGMMYSQVITPGYLIVLEADGKEWNYHASQTRVMYCDK